ncbi:MAG: LysE family translocator [Gemmatimonadaceae bacterium]
MVIGGEALFDGGTLLAYCLAATALVLAPGPGQALVIARSIEGGTRSGILTSLGLEIGTLVHTLAAALGLSAVLASSATAFTVVKYAGAAYLVVLGLLAFRQARRSTGAVVAAPPMNAHAGSRLVLHAAVTGALNPKVAVFFLAFLPQFVKPERGAVLAQFVALGLILAVLGFAFDSLVAATAGRARARLLASARFAAWRERLTGAVLIALGLRLALGERR